MTLALIGNGSQLFIGERQDLASIVESQGSFKQNDLPRERGASG